MYDSPESSSAPPVAASVATPQPRMHALPLVAMLVSVLALAAAGWSWSDSRERISDLKTELGRRLAESGKDVSESRLLARNSDDAIHQNNKKNTQNESQMA